MRMVGKQSFGCSGVRICTSSDNSRKSVFGMFVVLGLLLIALMVPGGSVNAQSPDGGVTTQVEFDAQSGSYVKVTRVGDMVINREYMTFEQ